ncbi:MAG: transposase, partial [Candidatus Aenigmarchaeota archaeon]|nr:transposase [Candidatus Aenigmarchaeota archaeon]
NNAVGAIHESPEKGNGAIHELPLQLKRRKMALPRIIGRFKMQSAKQINAIRNTPGVPVWQRNYYEHIIRDENDYLTIATYIENNPIKWELDKYYGSKKEEYNE